MLTGSVYVPPQPNARRLLDDQRMMLHVWPGCFVQKRKAAIPTAPSARHDTCMNRGTSHPMLIGH